MRFQRMNAAGQVIAALVGRRRVHALNASRVVVRVRGLVRYDAATSRYHCVSVLHGYRGCGLLVLRVRGEGPAEEVSGPLPRHYSAACELAHPLISSGCNISLRRIGASLQMLRQLLKRPGLQHRPPLLTHRHHLRSPLGIS